MNDVEKNLRAVRLAAPSEELERRMARLFSGRASQSLHKQRLVRWGWIAGLSATAVASSLILFWRASPASPLIPSPSPFVYEIVPQGMIREFLLTPPAHLQVTPQLVVSVER